MTFQGCGGPCPYGNFTCEVRGCYRQRQEPDRSAEAQAAEPDPQPQPTIYRHAVFTLNGVRIDILSTLTHGQFVMKVRADGCIISPGLYIRHEAIAGIFDQTAAPKPDGDNVIPLRGEPK